jgi:hypothetical protein
MRRGAVGEVCACAEPLPYQRPSGVTICINPSCGLPVGTPTQTKERP